MTLSLTHKERSVRFGDKGPPEDISRKRTVVGTYGQHPILATSEHSRHGASRTIAQRVDRHQRYQSNQIKSIACGKCGNRNLVAIRGVRDCEDESSGEENRVGCQGSLFLNAACEPGRPLFLYEPASTLPEKGARQASGSAGNWPRRASLSITMLIIGRKENRV